MPTPRQLIAQQRRAARERFRRVRLAENRYSSQLSQIGRHVGAMARGMIGRILTREQANRFEEAMQRYSGALRPWAEATGSRMIEEVSRRDLYAWIKLSGEVGKALGNEIRSAPTGEAMQASLERQVHYITSLPTDAAERVHKLTTEALVSGRRAEEIAKDILATGHVSVSRARLIARTEVGRTATALVQARAEYVGSEEYEWSAVMDESTRPLHRELNGHVFRWDDPPVSDPSGKRSHPGAGFNCRCVALPRIPDVID